MFFVDAGKVGGDKPVLGLRYMDCSIQEESDCGQCSEYHECVVYELFGRYVGHERGARHVQSMVASATSNNHKSKSVFDGENARCQLQANVRVHVTQSA